MRCFFHSQNFPFSFLFIPVLVNYNVPILQRQKKSYSTYGKEITTGSRPYSGTN